MGLNANNGGHMASPQSFTPPPLNRGRGGDCTGRIGSNRWTLQGRSADANGQTG